MASLIDKLLIRIFCNYCMKRNLIFIAWSLHFPDVYDWFITGLDYLSLYRHIEWAVNTNARDPWYIPGRVPVFLPGFPYWSLYFKKCPYLRKLANCKTKNPSLQLACKPLTILCWKSSWILWDYCNVLWPVSRGKIRGSLTFEKCVCGEFPSDTRHQQLDVWPERRPLNSTQMCAWQVFLVMPIKLEILAH